MPLASADDPVYSLIKLSFNYSAQNYKYVKLPKVSVELQCAASRRYENLYLLKLIPMDTKSWKKKYYFCFSGIMEAIRTGFLSHINDWKASMRKIYEKNLKYVKTQRKHSLDEKKAQNWQYNEVSITIALLFLPVVLLLIVATPWFPGFTLNKLTGR